MGKRRRKLLRRKYQAFPWNVYNKLHPRTTENSVMIQRVKDEIEDLTEDDLELLADMIEAQFGHLLNKPKPQVVEEPIEAEKQTVNLFENSVIEPELEKAPQVSLKKLLKRELLEIAKQKGVEVSSKNTKAQIIAAIETTD